MGIKERKKREVEAFRKLLLSTAHHILMSEGLEALTMRSLAHHIEYSQSKIYDFFESKDRLCEMLCAELCEKLLQLIEEIPLNVTAEELIRTLVFKTLEFHASHPHSDELFTLICFGGNRFIIPAAFKKVEKHFIKALQQLKSPYLQTEEEILSALDLIRCIFIGVSTLCASSSSLDGSKRALNIAEKGINALLRGWR